MENNIKKVNPKYEKVSNKDFEILIKKIKEDDEYKHLILRKFPFLFNEQDWDNKSFIIGLIKTSLFTNNLFKLSIVTDFFNDYLKNIWDISLPLKKRKEAKEKILKIIKATFFPEKMVKKKYPSDKELYYSYINIRNIVNDIKSKLKVKKIRNKRLKIEFWENNLKREGIEYKKKDIEKFVYYKGVYKRINRAKDRAINSPVISFIKTIVFKVNSHDLIISLLSNKFPRSQTTIRDRIAEIMSEEKFLKFINKAKKERNNIKLIELRNKYFNRKHKMSIPIKPFILQ